MRSHNAPARRNTKQSSTLHFFADKPSIQRSIANHVEYTLAGTRFNIDRNKAYLAAAHALRDRLIESWNDTNAYFEASQCKRAYYMSMEFLIGRYFQNCLLCTDLEDQFRSALSELGFGLEDLYEQEPDPALGNGGLGRLAACFLDSMAALDLPVWGYGLHYEYGIFKQVISEDGKQHEVPDRWLTMGNPWEIQRTDVTYPVRFYGSSVMQQRADGGTAWSWQGGEVVTAVACDSPVPGFNTMNVLNLRLWRAVPSTEFDLESFNAGDYMKAVESRQRAETITSVLYPADDHMQGQELRLKQQYLLVSATLQDITRRFLKVPGRKWEQFPELHTIQLNDTHPSLSIPELMRLLMDVHQQSWEQAWAITTRTFAYTNHTLLPEALERWSVALLSHLLPRHLDILYEINTCWLREVAAACPGDDAILSRLSLIEEGDTKRVRMAHLSVVGSHTVNGVAAIHSELVKTSLFPDFVRVLGGSKFTNITNGITPRRWIAAANPPLAALITSTLGSEAWLTDLYRLTALRRFASDSSFVQKWQEVKLTAKKRLASLVQRETGVQLDPTMLFDIQVKRIHEYKRQLMNALYCWHRYRYIKRLSPAQRAGKVVPRATIFAGKAAPGYAMAKRIIQFINKIARVINSDADVSPFFKVVFLPNYCVTLAERIIPASDISQHISTAGTEASGTSNMKFVANGGVILGTLDGANIEISAEVGEEHMFAFGAEAHETQQIRESMSFDESDVLCQQYEVQAVLDDLRIAVGEAPLSHGTHACGVQEAAQAAHSRFTETQHAAKQADLKFYGVPAVSGPFPSGLPADAFGPADDVRCLLHSLNGSNDRYLVRHDFASYVEANARVDSAFMDKDTWVRSSIFNCAGSGRFSTDRTIQEYASKVWRLEAAKRPAPESEGLGEDDTSSAGSAEH